MLRSQLLYAGLTAAALVAGGAVECSGTRMTASEVDGAHLYRRMCAVCHGQDGEGYRADQAPALANPRFLESVSDGFLRTAIAHGRSSTVMSAWSTARGGPLASTDIDSIIDFLHTWAPRARPALDEKPLAGDARRGAAIYTRECARCHGARGTGGPNVSIGHRDLLTTASNGFLRHAISQGRAPTAMPGFEASLGASGIEDVVAHLRSFAPAPAPPRRAELPARPPPLPLGPVPLNPKGPEPVGFSAHPEATPVDVVKRELDRGARMALLDARTPSDYTAMHLAGAVSVPFYDPSPYLSALPRDAWLVCYCACPSAESGMLAKALLENGFKKVTVLKEGLRLWHGKNYPTHSGEKP